MVQESLFLERRLGEHLFLRRVSLERRILSEMTPKRCRFFSKASLLKWGLRSLGLYKRGFRNYLDLQVVEREVHLPNLPSSFDGFRLLQLSDLHFGLSQAFLEALVAKLRGVVCDAVVFTGDYYSRFGLERERVVQAMAETLSVLPLPRWGILGNYDILEIVPSFEELDLRMLLNEHDRLERDGSHLFFCGVDDPALFRTQDLRRARQGIPPDACTILLAHSPEVWREAAALGYSFLLAGHTHGGQICFPGGKPIVCKTRVPFALMRGAWSTGGLSGYTSSGTGVSWLPVRFNCPAEITVHILRR